MHANSRSLASRLVGQAVLGLESVAGATLQLVARFRRPPGLCLCEFRELQLELQGSDPEACALLPKGMACITDGKCCSGNLPLKSAQVSIAVWKAYSRRCYPVNVVSGLSTSMRLGQCITFRFGYSMRG